MLDSLFLELPYSMLNAEMITATYGNRSDSHNLILILRLSHVHELVRNYDKIIFALTRQKNIWKKWKKWIKTHTPQCLLNKQNFKNPTYSSCSGIKPPTTLHGNGRKTTRTLDSSGPQEKRKREIKKSNHHHKVSVTSETVIDVVQSLMPAPCTSICGMSLDQDVEQIMQPASQVVTIALLAQARAWGMRISHNRRSGIWQWHSEERELEGEGELVAAASLELQRGDIN
jgi:hypothetical protein